MVRLSKIIVILIFFINFQAYAKNPPPGTASNIPANVIIMLDNSGSMGSYLRAKNEIYYPLDVATDSNGNVYALEGSSSGKIKIFNSSGTYLKSIGGGYGNGCNQWRYSYGMEIYNNKIYITDYYNGKLKVLDLNGNCIRSVNTASTTYTYWWGWSYTSKSRPTGVAVGSNYTYVSYYDAKKISVYRTSNLSFVKDYTFSSYLNYTYALDLNPSENTLLASNNYLWSWYGNIKPVTKFNLSGSSVSYSRTIGSVGSYWGSGSNGTFTSPWGVAQDSNDNIFVSDGRYNTVQKLNSSGTYQTKAGTHNSYNTSGPFYYPHGVSVDSSDNVYVADYYNKSIRKFDNNLNLLESYGGSGGTLMDIAKKVIKKIVSDSTLTGSANFGFMTWGSGHNMRVKVSGNGAKQIYSNIDNVTNSGGGTYLYGAMVAARNQFLNGKVPNWNLTCSNNYLLVISDGAWWGGNPNGVASSLYNRSPGKVKTYVVGFAYGGSKTNYNSLAKAGGTGSPLFADDQKQLLEKLKNILKQISSSKATFNTPAVMEETKTDNYAYQATFQYISNGQWPGYLKKYKLNSNGTIGNEIWDAATKLNNKKAANRNIWTVGLSSKSINNFTTSYRNELKNKLFPNGIYPTTQASPTDAQTDDLINFVRGLDSYDEDNDNNTSDERHKLNDIYHSDPLVIRPVESSITDDGSSNFQKKDAYYRLTNQYKNFKDGNSCGGSCTNRKEILIAGSNGGMLHAFDTSNGSNGGEELWAFIPPNLLGRLSNVISGTANQTNAIYGVDGSSVYKDIYYDDTPTNNIKDPSWKTILLTGLGSGGHGYFALDITDVNSPKHLFSIENDTFNQHVKHWDSNGSLTQFSYSGGNNAPAEYDFRQLGEAWSTPRIIRIKHNGQDKWVAVFGGGYNGAVNGSYGNYVYVIDLEDEGKLLKKITIPDWGNRIDSIVNAVPSDLTVITANGTDKANYSGAMVYVADLEGKINKINMTDIDESGNIVSSPTYSTTVLFDAESGTNNERYIYHSAEATINDDGNLWLYFGTGDTQKLETIPNTYNRVYGIKDKDFPYYKSISRPGKVAQCKKPPACPGSNDLGWYVELKDSQKLTAQVTIDNNLVYYPLYRPAKASKCAAGDAVIAHSDVKCGNTTFLASVGKGVLSKIVVNKGKIYVGISGEAKTKYITGFDSKDNLITGKSASTAKKSGGQIQLEGWKEH